MNEQRRKWLLFVALVALLGLPWPAPAAECTITGRVVDYVARPVAGAEVAVYQRVFDHLTAHDSGVLRGEIGTTDAEGRFRLTADVTFSPVNIHMIVVRKDGYALGWDYLGRVEDNLIVLEKPHAIRGMLVDADGRPVPGAQVRAAPKSTYLRRLDQTPVLAPEPWLTTETDAEGAFAFESFSADVSADFWVTAPGWAQVYQFTTNMMSACGYEVGRTDVRLVLPREVPLRGKVIDQDSGEPVAEATVLLHPERIDHDKAPFIPKMTTTEADGGFAFDGVPLGRRRIEVSAPLETGLVDRRVTFDVTADIDPKEVTVELLPGGTIELTAREQETGRPIPNLVVSFRQAAQNEQSDFYRSVTTDANGLALVNAPLGQCAFSTRSDTYSPMFYEDQVQVQPGQTTQEQIMLDRYVHVSGLVVDESGHPVPDARITDALEPSAHDGRFEARFSPDEPPVVWIARQEGRNLAAVVRNADIEQAMRITLKPALTVSGRVTDPNGKGIPAARVALSMRIPGIIMPYAPDVATDVNGCYEINAVAPKQDEINYRLSIDASGYGNRLLSIPDDSEQHIELDPVVLQPADQSITGVVLDANGLPGAGLPIFAHGDNQPSRVTATDNSGQFVIHRVCRGPMRLQASFESSPGGAGFLDVEGGDRDVTIVLGRKGAHLRYVSLVGKPLPNGGDCGLDLASTELQGKRILLCFFDYQQRPSRNVLGQLAEKAEVLEDEGVVFMAVQASTVEAETLKAWTDQVSLTIPIGRIADDVDAARLAWGVRSLPWLVLTDAEHRVVAEGLSIVELDETIAAAQSGDN